MKPEYFTTPWTHPVKADEESQLGERDQLFASHVRDVADIKLPWLFPLLLACQAQVYAEPGLFLFSIPSGESPWYSVPEIGMLIVGVPWVEETHQIH